MAFNAFHGGPNLCCGYAGAASKPYDYKAAWLTLQRTQQRIDDCFTKYYLIKLTISACKVFNEFVDLADQHHLTERPKQAAAAAPDWSAERSALQHVLGQLSLPSLRDEARLAGVEPGLVDAAPMQAAHPCG